MNSVHQCSGDINQVRVSLYSGLGFKIVCLSLLGITGVRHHASAENSDGQKGARQGASWAGELNMRTYLKRQNKEAKGATE